MYVDQIALTHYDKKVVNGNSCVPVIVRYLNVKGIDTVTMLY